MNGQTDKPTNQLVNWQITNQLRGTLGHTLRYANLIIIMLNSLVHFRLTRIGSSSPIQQTKLWRWRRRRQWCVEDYDDEIYDNGDDLRDNYGENGENDDDDNFNHTNATHASPTPLQREIHNFPLFLRIKKSYHLPHTNVSSKRR